MRTKEETRIKRAHITLMQHSNTALYSGIIASGKNEVRTAEEEGELFTAYTDGIDKIYCHEEISKKEYEYDPVLRALVLHENLHVALKHLLRCRDLSKENHQLLNMAMDFVVDDVIKHTGGTVVTTKSRW